MARKTKTQPALAPNNALVIDQTSEETGAQAMARKLLEPQMRHALTASTFAAKMLGSKIEGPGIMDYVGHVESMTANAEKGDLTIASRLLIAQAVTLDSMFTELARRTALNMGEYIQAAERYGRLALKAQSNCRATIESLVKLHQPREQTVRHVHVNEGGQAVVADHFHNHTGGKENGETTDQCDATAAAGASPSLPCPDPLRDGMPIPGREGQAAMSNARRDKPRPT